MDERFPVSSDAHEELPLVSYGIIRDQEILECIVGGEVKPGGHVGIHGVELVKQHINDTPSEPINGDQSVHQILSRIGNPDEFESIGAIRTRNDHSEDAEDNVGIGGKLYYLTEEQKKKLDEWELTSEGWFERTIVNIEHADGTIQQAETHTLPSNAKFTEKVSDDSQRPLTDTERVKIKKRIYAYQNQGSQSTTPEHPTNSTTVNKTESYAHQPTITQRGVEQEDIPQIRKILSEWIKDPLTGEILIGEIDEVLLKISDSVSAPGDREYIVAEDESGNILGLMGLREPEDALLKLATTANPIELVNAYVSSDKKGQGIGKLLLEKIQEIAKNNGHTEIILNSGPRYRESAWSFYDKQFGNRIGELKDYYGPGLSAPVWHKVLAM